MNEREISFTVPGNPVGKGRPRFVRATGRTYTPEQTARYENLVKLEYERQANGMFFRDGKQLGIRISAFFQIPKSASKTSKKMMEEWELRPTKKPDVDNILKSIADALNGVAYHDDKQIVYCEVSKKYTATNPFVKVKLWEL